MGLDYAQLGSLSSRGREITTTYRALGQAAKRRCRRKWLRRPTLLIKFECKPEITQQTPLMSCRFKRLTVDEGNKVAGQSELAEGLAAQLNAEDRCVVSGTPTESLVGAPDVQDWSAIEQARVASSSSS
ncbi:unnamed protein product [Sympodiomycopsis kandeliae]